MFNGFYSIYYTGVAGTGFGLVALKDGVVTGVDVAGGKIDGRYAFNEKSQKVEGVLTLVSPPGGALVTGVATGPTGLTMQLPLTLPPDFGGGETIGVQTPYGPVNVSIRKIRDLN